MNLKFSKILIYILGALLVVSSIYASFVYLPEYFNSSKQLAIISEPITGKDSQPECPICECPNCKPKEIIKEIIKEMPVEKEKIVYKDNPEQTETIRKLESDLAYWKRLAEEYMRLYKISDSRYNNLLRDYEKALELAISLKNELWTANNVIGRLKVRLEYSIPDRDYSDLINQLRYERNQLYQEQLLLQLQEMIATLQWLGQ